MRHEVRGEGRIRWMLSLGVAQHVIIPFDRAVTRTNRQGKVKTRKETVRRGKESTGWLNYLWRNHDLRIMYYLGAGSAPLPREQ